ncbi:unnamed protein product [Prunus armeniaca]
MELGQPSSKTILTVTNVKTLLEHFHPFVMAKVAYVTMTSTLSHLAQAAAGASLALGLAQAGGT